MTRCRTCASAPPAGTTRPGRARGTACSIPPRGGRGRRAFDELRFYAEHFDTVEVNSTFYGQPRAEVTRGWAERTPAGFEFSRQAVSEVHAPADVQGDASAEVRLPGVDRRGCCDALAQADAADLDEFRRGIDPLARRGKLGALLAQFPASFKAHAGSRATTWRRCSSAFADYRVAVELRHKSWSDALGDTLTLLERASSAAWVQIDEPKFRFSIRAELPAERRPASTTCACTAGTPRSGGATTSREDRYNYLYSAEELKEFSRDAPARRGSW